MRNVKPFEERQGPSLAYGVADHWRDSLVRPRTIAPRSERVELGRGRLAILAGIFVVAFGALAWRVGDLSLQGGEAAPTGMTAAPQFAARADILDRNGAILARDLVTHEISVNPALLADPAEAAAAIARRLPGLNAATLKARFARAKETGKRVTVRLDAVPKEVEAIFELGLPDVQYPRSFQRAYPARNLFSHVVGFVDVDNKGIQGLELSRDADLRALSRAGTSLELSLDSDIQFAVHEELKAGLSKYGAKAAIAILMQAESGEILSMVSLPDFDPNDPASSAPEERKNLATAATYEMGSTFKPFTFAAGLDARLFDLDQSFDARKPMRVSGRMVRDFYPENRWLTATEVFLHSSNIGTAQMAQMIGIERQRDFLSRAGLLTPSPVELPEVAKPIVLDRWGPVESATISFGYGLSVTPLQLASGIAALVNGGTYVAPTILKRAAGEPVRREQIVSAETSRRMRYLMRTNVVEGTGKSADIEGYEVGGKTGTAQKITAGSYDPGRRVSSFVSIFPSRRPEYLMLVMLDEPTRAEGPAGTRPTGGATAAPLSGHIIRRIAPIMGLKPINKDSHDELASLSRGY